jgi:hypothetical protein
MLLVRAGRPTGRPAKRSAIRLDAGANTTHDDVRCDADESGRKCCRRTDWRPVRAQPSPIGFERRSMPVAAETFIRQHLRRINRSLPQVAAALAERARMAAAGIRVSRAAAGAASSGVKTRAAVIGTPADADDNVSQPTAGAAPALAPAARCSRANPQSGPGARRIEGGLAGRPCGVEAAPLASSSSRAPSKN